jgi:hypothetical protein
MMMVFFIADDGCLLESGVVPSSVGVQLLFLFYVWSRIRYGVRRAFECWSTVLDLFLWLIDGISGRTSMKMGECVL